MQRKSARAVWAFFVLLLGSSLFLLFNEQRKPVEHTLAVLKQPGSIGLVYPTATQGLFSKNFSSIFDFILIAVLVLSALLIKRWISIYPQRDIKKNIEHSFLSPQVSKLKNDQLNELRGNADFINSRLKVLEDELRKKDDFIAIASHELKTPLSSLKIYIQTLELVLKAKGQNEYREYLEKINEQVNKLSHLVTTRLEIARIEGGKITYLKKSLDLEGLIKSIISDMHMLGTHTIQFESSLSIPAYGDKNRIAQVVQNLLSNAIKYSPGKPHIEIKLFQKNSKAIVSIVDHGIGIDEKFHKKIFDRFFRINRDIEGVYTGLGVGLFISCQIIEHHDGTIWVESTPGSGSTFYFSLPLAREFV